MKKLITFLFFLTTIASFAQSPWTQEKGKAYTQISFTTIPSYNSVYGNPNYEIAGNLIDNTLQFYGEYGITDHTSILVSIPYKRIVHKNLVNPCLVAPCPEFTNKEASLGNIEVSLKHNFSKKDWIISGQLGVEANTGSFDIDTGIRTGYDAWTITPLFLIGKGLEKSYFQGFIGANIRSNNYSSNFKIGGEYGKKIAKNIWLVGFIDIVKSFENGNVVLPASNLATALYVNNQEYGAFGLKSIFEIKEKFGITGGFGGAFFGNNVAQSPALTFGVYQKF